MAHPTQKPLALFTYLINTYTLPDELVLDPFCGSGTTALACVNTGRRYVCGDLNPAYVEAANLRLSLNNPYADKPVAPGLVQPSLFSAAEKE